MIEIINQVTDPYFNMALEEYLVQQLEGQQDFFMLWQNRPAVIVGRNQNTLEEINSDYIDEQGITVVRRLSGGGAVYHDQGNLNFTFVLNDPRDFANFEKFTRPVIKALKRLGIAAENNGRNDITIGGRKFSGNAQFKYRDRLLHHGTILWATDIEMMVQALNPSGTKISSKGIKSVRSRVTNLTEHLSAPLAMEEFKRLLTEEVALESGGLVGYQLGAKDLALINKLRERRYSTWDWNYGSSPAFNLQRTRSFPWGQVDLRVDIKRGAISACRIYGDYFAGAEMAELESQLVGISYQEAAVRSRLTAIDLSAYLPQLSVDEFIDLLFK